MNRWLAPGAASAVILVGIVLAYQSAAYSIRSGSDAPLYSIRRHDPYGTAALAALLAERGADVRTLERASLDSADHGVLIQVLPMQETPLDHHLQTRQIADWIEQGNRVIQFARSSTDLMEHYHIAPSTQPIFEDGKTVQTAEQHGDAIEEISPVVSARLDTLTGKRLSLCSPMDFAPDQPAAWKPIARLVGAAGAVVAGEFHVGKGKLIIIGAPTPALNGSLGDQANLDFILATVGNAPVIFDEWSHGIGHEATIIGFIHDAGLLPVLLQLGFLAILYGWSARGYRYPDNPTPPRQRSSIEQIETLGFLYGRSLNVDLAYHRVEAEVRRRLIEALRCPPHELNARVAALTPSLHATFEQLTLRLAKARSAHGPRCMICGYDLTQSKADRCPECGAVIPASLRQSIADASATHPSASARKRRSRSDAALAEALNLSHQLAQEVQRERRVVR